MTLISIIQNLEAFAPPANTANETETKEIEIGQRLSELNAWGNDAAKYGSWASVLGGNTPIHMTGNSTSLPLWKFTSEQNLSQTITAMPLKLWTGLKWETGADLNKLAIDKPNDRWKYYFSLNLQDPHNTELAENFFSKILKIARINKLSLMTKTEDHLYDSLLIYTWDVGQMDTILSELYGRYPSMWTDVRRVFQKPIVGINPLHIARVQEPMGGVDGNSHTTRMYTLGKYIDTRLSDSTRKWSIDTQTFLEACLTASVKPEAPWMVQTI